MIRAYEAAKIAADSDEEVKKVVEKIGKKIEEQAALGKRFLQWHEGRIGCRNDCEFEAERDNGKFVNLVIEELKKYGYGAAMYADMSHQYKVGIDDDGPFHNIVLKVSW